MKKKEKLHPFKKKTQRHSFLRLFFLTLTLVVYFIFVAKKFGAKDGLFISILTWSFFVFCTPVADAGFMVGFPLRIFAKVRMVHSQIAVWIIALFLNLYALFFNPDIYHNTLILKLFHHILVQPFPYWIIIIISAAGTYLSIHFGDELLDVTTHKNREKYHQHLNKYQIITFVFLILLIIVIYDFLLKKMGINIHL